MKRISLVAAFAVSLLSLSAESVTIEHTTESGIEAELNAAIEASGTLTSIADITDLTIIGEAAMTADDFKVLRENMATTLVNLDMSQAFFTNNTIPGSVYNPNGALSKMTSLVSVKIPETIVTIGGGCFDGCENLQNVNLPEGLTQIWNYTFRNCKKINFEKFPENVKVFNPYCFQSCINLTTGVLPPNTRSIMEYAFHKCPVTFSELPQTVETIKQFAFSETKVSFSKLPPKITEILNDAFNVSDVTFSEFPDGLQSIGDKAFRNTKVKFTTFPASLTKLGTAVFCNITPDEFPEFTIPNVAGLWGTIPNQTFYVGDGSTPRSFICRSNTPPSATVDGKAYTGVFGQATEFPNITFKVLASAMESFGNTAPYNTMNLVALTTPVMEPVIEMPEGVSADYVKVSFIVNGVEHTDFTGEVLEGEGQFKVDFTEEANSKLYVQEIRFVTPAANEEGDGDGSADEEEPADPDLLYEATGESKDLFKKSVEVAVNVAPGMNAIRVKIAEGNPVSGTEAVEATANTVTRQGNIFYLTLPGAEVYDIAGRMVASSVTNTIDISRLPAGAYILRAGKSAVKILK